MIVSALLSLLAGLRGGNPLPFLVLSSNGNSFPPPLSRAEETELFRRARREGDEAAREKLIEVGTHEWIQAHDGQRRDDDDGILHGFNQQRLPRGVLAHH